MIRTAILGTGTVGQRFAQFLEGHPTFEVVEIAGSESRAGDLFGTVPWHGRGENPFGHVPIMEAGQITADVVFSAIPGHAAGIERTLAERGKKVFTNASPHRMDADVPLLIPEINPDALDVVQGKRGFIVANGNCTGIILTLPLAALQPFGIEEVHVTSMQALSGAGYPGVSAMDVVDNIVPYIHEEEAKLAEEPPKVLGEQFPIYATCTRVPVRDGHFEDVRIKLRDRPTAEVAAKALASFQGSAEVRACRMAPEFPIMVAQDPARPQPVLDRDAANGMAVTVGRIEVQGGWLRFVVLGHNTVRGAAGQSVLNAEFAFAKGLL